MLFVSSHLSCLTRVVCVLAMLMLGACGGGSSDSGGSVDSSAAKLLGKQSIVLTSSNSVISAKGSLQLSVNGATGTITLQDSDFSASSVMTNNSFSVSSPQLNIIASQSNRRCTGTVTYSGNANPLEANGDLSGELRCDGETFTVSGSFFAEPISSKIVPVAESFGNTVQKVL